MTVRVLLSELATALFSSSSWAAESCSMVLLHLDEQGQAGAPAVTASARDTTLLVHMPLPVTMPGQLYCPTAPTTAICTQNIKLYPVINCTHSVPAATCLTIEHYIQNAGQTMHRNRAMEGNNPKGVEQALDQPD